MSGLRLKLLGGFELRPGSGAPIPLPARKPALLLAYLALRQGQPQGRDKLAGLFWGDRGEVQARASLRQALADLRRRLGPHEGLIQAPEGETVALARDGLATDVAEFERCLAAGGRDALEHAGGLYEGDLLDGFQAPRQPLLEEWLVAERQRLRERALAAMAALLPDIVAADPPEAGVRLALRILALDPLQEVAHRALMRLHARQGRRGAALARYQMLREALARELGVPPEEETQQLYKELRDRRGAAEDRAAVPEEPPAEAPATAATPARRPLTILACDLWGSDALASRLGLEGMHDLLDLYQQAVVGEISRLEGYVARLAGASVVAWFGWPKALDDAAERAVRAGLAAPAAVGRLKGPDGEPLAAQVGIATGSVAVNDPAVGERAVVGAAPVLASGLRTLARPGTVLLSEGTRGLVDGLFELEALGPRRVGELAGEVAPAWRARAARRAEVERVRQAFADPRGPGSGNVDSPVGPNARGAVPLLARDAELRHLREGLAKALDATRQVVFVTGEPGIGKTALVEAFIGHVALADPAVRIGRGQCLKHRGPGEAYLPILEALDRLCRVPASGDEVIRLLDRHAPTWLAQMPGLLEPAALEALERRNRSATRERMLREMAKAVEAISAGRPLLLAIEDLQWSDDSTIDLLSGLAQRLEPARMMVIGTCRPAEAKPDGHPLHATVRELCRQGRATELALAFLDEAAVAEYLRSRLPPPPPPAPRPRLLHERTDGNPLFVVDLVESWIAQGLLARTAGAWSLPATPEALAADLPLSLRQLIEQQLNQLAAEDEETLEEASVVGRVFSSALVAVAGERDAEETERRCARQARAGRLMASRGVAEWSDGTIASSYGFVHDLYREVLYDRVPAGRRARLHRRCGACLEQSYGPHAVGRAAELASHFLRGRDFGRALGYLQLAARQAFRRSAHPEAIGHLDQALGTLRHLSDDGERARAELALQTLRGEILTVTEGWSSRAAESAFLRARELCRHAPDEPPELARILYGLANLYEFRGEFATSAALIEQCLALPATQDGAAFLQAQEILACSLSNPGQVSRSPDPAGPGTPPG